MAVQKAWSFLSTELYEFPIAFTVLEIVPFKKPSNIFFSYINNLLVRAAGPKVSKGTQSQWELRFQVYRQLLNTRTDPITKGQSLWKALLYHDPFPREGTDHCLKQIFIWLEHILNIQTIRRYESLRIFPWAMHGVLHVSKVRSAHNETVKHSANLECKFWWKP